MTLILLTASAYAQERFSADHIVTRMKSDLNLNPDQLPAVQLIIEENMAERQEISPQSSEGLSQDQSLPLDMELYQKLGGVLTRSQMNHWNFKIMVQEMDANNTN